ncbi:hypothetical protein L6164_029235 [Bauhinia variegata]|uniref:Uncharacterized protein n=1 Tax=Bauhinia variegata TaxID=167791 RepID=A0ACB9L819_BAUVA|nr:hypothetical protein L6164_029235 [Bauhinia variegata]
MDSLLGFTEEAIVDQQKQPSYARKLVPWLNWDEWLVVKDSLFSNSPDAIASALQRISAWRSRGCLPVVIEVTASIIEIQQRDPHYRVDQSNDASLSEEMLAMLYCMAIMRLVNGVVEKTRKKELTSIAVAADAIGIPRMLIDIRHEGSHRELPALQVVRSASVKALDWLKSYYWEPQHKSIPFQGDGNTEIRKEIKSKLRHLAFCLKDSQTPQSSGSLCKGKRVKHDELLCGRNKLLTLAAANGQASRSGGSKKQIKKILKSLVPLYSSFSSEIVSVLLEFLLQALPSSEFMVHEDDASVGPTIHSVLADWKVIIVKFWNKEPELLPNLLNTVLERIETREAMMSEEDSRAMFHQIEHLSSLFAWLVGVLSTAPSAETNAPKGVLLELLRKCLQISAPGNKQLMVSALHLAQLIDENSTLIEKVKKLTLLGLSNLDNIDGQSSSVMTTKNLLLEEESIHQAAKKLDVLKQQVIKKKTPMSMDCRTVKSNRWTLAKSWNPCPIGMLPRAAGSSGRLPVLDCIDNQDKNQVSERKEPLKLSLCSAKRDATLDLDLLDNSTVKKMKGTAQTGGLKNQVFPLEGEKGCLMIGGVWKRVGEEELLDIQSSVRILI